MSAPALTRPERRAALSLAGIFALRMLGLFMIYPVFAVYARELPDATPARIGLALGIYGLAQACCQIPLGLLSDRWGRKPVIAVGLIVFALGSVVAAQAHSLPGITLGRLLQGTGAVGSAILALAADLSRAETRTKVMALIGMTIGLSFALAVIIGPILNGWIGVPGMFWLTAAFAAGGLLLLYLTVPTPAASSVQVEAEAVPSLLLKVLRDPGLLRLDFGILAQHAILTATFLGLPLLLQASGLSEGRQWLVYLPALVVSALTMLPLIQLAERPGRLRAVMFGAVATIGLAQVGFATGAGLWPTAVSLMLFMTAFNYLEAALPSMISRLAPAGARGTALGIYSSAQFLGIFLGGVLGGWCQQTFGAAGGFGFSLVLAVLWGVVTWSVCMPAAAAPR